MVFEKSPFPDKLTAPQKHFVADMDSAGRYRRDAWTVAWGVKVCIYNHDVRNIATTAEGMMTYLANARESAFLALTFWLLMKESTVTAIARSMSCAEQYSDRRILQKASAIRMMASR